MNDAALIARRKDARARFTAAINDKSGKLHQDIETALKGAQTGISVEYWKQVLMGTIQDTPELLDCEPSSLVAAVYRAAQLGLSPGKHAGQVWILPYQDKKRGITVAQFIIGYKGIIALARRNPGVRNVIARTVYAGDEFSYRLGLHEDLVHVPSMAPVKGRGMTHVYAVCHYAEAPPTFIVMDQSQVDAIRRRSKSNYGPWSTDYDAMARKTAVRHLATWIDLDDRAAEAIFGEDDLEADARDTEDVTRQNFGSKLNGLLSGDGSGRDPSLESGDNFEPEPERVEEAAPAPVAAAKTARARKPTPTAEVHEPAVSAEDEPWPVSEGMFVDNRETTLDPE